MTMIVDPDPGTAQSLAATVGAGIVVRAVEDL